MAAPSDSTGSNSHRGWAIFITVVFVALIIGLVAWMAIRQMRARSLGLPRPDLFPFAFPLGRQRGRADFSQTPAPGGVQGWINAKIRSYRNPRSAGGAYENTSYRVDDAWNADIGHERLDGDEQEMGVHDPAQTRYEGLSPAPVVGVGGIETGRGRNRDRLQQELEQRYETGTHSGSAADAQRQDPFGDHAEHSDMPLRGMSPRPMADADHKARAESVGSSSPTERQAVFREDV